MNPDATNPTTNDNDPNAPGVTPPEPSVPEATQPAPSDNLAGLSPEPSNPAPAEPAVPAPEEAPSAAEPAAAAPAEVSAAPASGDQETPAVTTPQPVSGNASGVGKKLVIIAGLLVLVLAVLAAMLTLL